MVLVLHVYNSFDFDLIFKLTSILFLSSDTNLYIIRSFQKRNQINFDLKIKS